MFRLNDSPANGMCFCQGSFASMGDHDIPTLEGESNELAGYHMMGRLFAVGYMRGLLDTTAPCR